jgi:hypothetical protein
MEFQSTINNHIIIYLDGDEIATAIDAYLVSQRIYVHGPRTITANGTILRNVKGKVMVEGKLIVNGKCWANDTQLGTIRHSKWY